MSNKEIARAFKLLASLMELHGDNPFKIRSYSSAARTIERYPQQLSGLSTNVIGKIKGIGKTSSEKIEQLLANGSFPKLEQMIAQTPTGILDMLSIKGLGPKKIKVLWQELGIESTGELLYACNENRLVSLKGFGAKTQANIKQSVEYVMANAHKFLYASVEAEAIQWLKTLAAREEVGNISFTGAYRRQCPTVEQIDLLIAISETTDVYSFVQSLRGLIIEDQRSNDTLVYAKTPNDIPLALHFCQLLHFNYQLFITTASETHLNLLDSNLQQDAYPDEVSIYKTFGIPYIEPPMREGIGELDLAKQQLLPDLVKASDIKGVVHAHSTYSDGKNTLKEMAERCIALGYEYLGITDHSKAAFYAGGLTEKEITQQHQEIDALNQILAPFKIFKGIEADILHNGDLDYDDDVLSSFDFVIASVHSNLKMDKEKAMMRLLKAIENEHTTILGHVTGRLLLSRKGYPVDHKKIIDACAANGVAIEINANPLRLDIDWHWIPYCLEKGVLLSINPDAHNLAGIEHIKYGILAAQKGGLDAHNTLNSKGLEEFNKYLTKLN